MAVAFGHFLVARNSVLEAAGDQGLAPYLKMYDDAGAIGPRPFHTKLAEAQNAVDETLQAYLLGQTTLEEAMINGKALIEALGPRE